MPQSFRSLIYLWSAVFSAAAVGAATLQAYGPVSPRAAETQVPAASAQPVVASMPRPAQAEEPAGASPVIDLASPSPAVLTAGITALSKLPLPPVVVAPASVPSQPVVASAAPSQPAQPPRVRAPAPVRRTPPMEEAFAPPPPAPLPLQRSQGYASYAPTGYIGVYTRSPDGMRMFRSYP